MLTHPHDRRDEMPVNRNGHAQTFREEGEITHGIIHITAVNGKTADQHFRFHTAPKAKNAEGLYTGRGWRNGAYHSYIGKDGRRELLLDYEVVGNHSGDWNMNRDSIGLVVEGRYHAELFPDELIQPVVDEALWHEKKLGRRLVWTWHDEVQPGRECPGRFFPKEEILKRIKAHYDEPDEPGPEPESEPEEPVPPPDTVVVEPEVVEPEEPPLNERYGCFPSIAPRPLSLVKQGDYDGWEDDPEPWFSIPTMILIAFVIAGLVLMATEHFGITNAF